MKTEFEYIALFLDPTELRHKTAAIRSHPLAKTPPFPHVTFAFKPQPVDTSLFGEKAKIIITGYGNNLQNEGVSVNLNIENEALRELAKAIAVPHITLSLAMNAKAVNTRFLHFEPVAPIVLNGIFGGYVKRKKRVILTPPKNENE